MQVYNFQDKYNALDNDFEIYLRDKSVAIVGRSQLHDLEQGEFIDAHDVVARVHYPVPYVPGTEPWVRFSEEITSFVPADWHSRLGARVNVFYHKVFSVAEMEYVLPLFYAAGGRFLSVEYSENLCYLEAPQVRAMASCRYLTNDHRINTMETIDHIALAGSLAIADFLRFDIKSLYITGFPCLYTREGIPQCTPWMAFKNLNWIRNLYETYEEIDVDRNMKHLFDIVPREYQEAC